MITSWFSNRAALGLLLFACAGLAACKRTSAPRDGGGSAAGRNLLVDPGLKDVRVLEQNWSDEQARRYYNDTQGSRMMPYLWFLHLEQAGSTALFRDAANMRSMGYLPRSPDSKGNPDGLPVGFALDGDREKDGSLGLTCSACHTAQVNYKGTAWLIDGGPTMADAQKFMKELVAALKATRADGEKFNRFASAVLGPGPAEAARGELTRDLEKLIPKREGYNERNFPAPDLPAFGPGRIDAFGAIFNEVAARFAQVPDAETQCDAPVSYPFLWDTPRHDRVQWNGSGPNISVGNAHIGALGRNVAEVVGVFADVDTTNKEIPLRGYTSSVNMENLKDLEELLRELWSPEWPAEFGAVNPALAAEGKQLFAANCAGCHESLKRDDPKRKVTARMSAVGTDETMARNAAERKSASGIFEGRWVLFPEIRKLGPVEPTANLLSHMVQRVLVSSNTIKHGEEIPYESDVFVELEDGGAGISAKLDSIDIVKGELRKARIKSLAILRNGAAPVFQRGSDLTDIPMNLAKFLTRGVGRLKEFSDFNAGEGKGPAVKYQYKARPLNGIWATGPYLHNGSVLNLDELLKRAADRKTTFRIGTREFDPEHVGFEDVGDFVFDTQAQPGNSNKGHEYGPAEGFSAEQRKSLIEYMKTL